MLRYGPIASSPSHILDKTIQSYEDFGYQRPNEIEHLSSLLNRTVIARRTQSAGANRMHFNQCGLHNYGLKEFISIDEGHAFRSFYRMVEVVKGPLSHIK